MKAFLLGIIAAAGITFAAQAQVPGPIVGCPYCTGQQVFNLNVTPGLPPGVDTNAATITIGKDAGGRQSSYTYASGSNLSGFRANGTKLSPSALALNDQIWTLSGFGYGATGYVSGAKAQLRMSAAEAWTDTAAGTYFDFFTTLATTTTLVDRWRITDAGVLTGAAGNPLAWTSSATSTSGTPDTGVSRLAAAVVGFGNGTQGDTSATLKFAAVQPIGTIPAVTGTGTPAITTGSTDTAGQVTGGTLATSIVITFATSKTNSPFCVVTPQTTVAAFAYTISNTAITITLTATTGESVNYICAQR